MNDYRKKTEMTHYNDKFFETPEGFPDPLETSCTLENWDKPTTCTFKRYPVDACLPCPPMPENLAKIFMDDAKEKRWIDNCARCGNDEGIERNLGYKVNICSECWRK